MALKPPLQKYTMVESDFFLCHFRINRNVYPRPATRSWQLRRQPAAANILFVIRLNDRAGEMRYIDPVTEQERSSQLWLRQIGGHNARRDSNGQLRTTSAQAIWMGVDHNAHTEANGSRIENDANNNIQSRLGFRTFIRTQEKNSGPHGDDFEPFVEMNGIHNSKDFAVSINGVKVEQDGARNLGK